MPQITWKDGEWFDPYEEAHCYAANVDGIRVVVKAKVGVRASVAKIRSVAERIIEAGSIGGTPPAQVLITKEDLVA